MVALIPARAGSKRCPGKNTRLLAGHPLIAYTIAAAQQSGVFEDIQVWTDDLQVNLAVCDSGVSVHARKPSTDDEPDITWIRRWAERSHADAFAILRPTSPFRTAATIRRAHRQFYSAEGQYRSLRAVEPATQTPFKMWELTDHGRMQPVVARCHPSTVPFHSSPTQTLPQVFMQNASLEMSLARNVTELGTIHGKTVYPFFTDGMEGFDINTEADFAEAEHMASVYPQLLPTIGVTA